MRQTAEALDSDDLGLAQRAAELKLVSPMPEQTEGDSLSVEERVVLSFNNHPVLETTIAAMTLTGIGFALGATIFAHRRRTALAFN